MIRRSFFKTLAAGLASASLLRSEEKAPLPGEKPKPIASRGGPLCFLSVMGYPHWTPKDPGPLEELIRLPFETNATGQFKKGGHIGEAHVHDANGVFLENVGTEFIISTNKVSAGDRLTLSEASFQTK